jgi:excisionase family DNA binding protein
VKLNLITTKEAAVFLGVSWQRVQQLAGEGKLGAVAAEDVGRRRILYRRSDVERLRVERGVGRYGRTDARTPCLRPGSDRARSFCGVLNRQPVRPEESAPTPFGDR